MSQMGKPSQSLVNMTQSIYILQLVSIFFAVYPILIPYFLNSLYKEKAKDTWIDWHFKWQMQTFWICFIFMVVIGFFLVSSLFVKSTTLALIPLPILFLSPLFFLILILCTVVTVILRTYKGLKKFIEQMDSEGVQ